MTTCHPEDRRDEGSALQPRDVQIRRFAQP
jgi:hypothetical protein